MIVDSDLAQMLIENNAGEVHSPALFDFRYQAGSGFERIGHSLADRSFTRSGPRPFGIWLRDPPRSAARNCQRSRRVCV